MDICRYFHVFLHWPSASSLAAVMAAVRLKSAEIMQPIGVASHLEQIRRTGSCLGWEQCNTKPYNTPTIIGNETTLAVEPTRIPSSNTGRCKAFTFDDTHETTRYI